MPIIKVLDKWHNFFINFYWLNKAMNLCDNLLKTYFQFFEEIEMGDVFYELINTHNGLFFHTSHPNPRVL